MISPRIQHPAKILLGVDGSEHGLAAVSLIKDLPCAGETSVKAVSVWSGRAQADRARMEKALQQALGLMGGGCARVETELRQGHPAEALIAAAEEYRPDLIVVGAKGLRATLGILLGGVAQQVVEHACCAVLVVRAPYMGLGRLLVVTDGSETSKCAVDYAARMSLPASAEVKVCHVVPPLGLMDYSTGTWAAGHEMVPVMSDEDMAELEKLHEDDRQRGLEILQQAAGTLAEHGTQAGSVLLEGDAATEILKYAKAQRVDLIAAGSRGLSEVRGWLMGSVSRKLVNFAGCSVLIVKDKAYQQRAWERWDEEPHLGEE